MTSFVWEKGAGAGSIDMAIPYFLSGAFESVVRVSDKLRVPTAWSGVRSNP